MNVKKETNRRLRKPFKGDAAHRLPAGMREPYRLWFEFLKLAHRDPSLRDQINTKFYAPWGDIVALDFKKFWKANWRTLFGVPLSVVELDTISHDALRGLRLTLSIDPAAPIEATLREVKAIIQDRTAGMPRKKLGVRQQGQFSLTGMKELKRPHMQQALKVYELSLVHDDLDDIVRGYIEWAKAWNDKIEAKGWQRDRIRTPSQFGNHDKVPKLDNDRRSNRRVLQRARKIAANVARGEFPGRY